MTFKDQSLRQAEFALRMRDRVIPNSAPMSVPRDWHRKKIKKTSIMTPSAEKALERLTNLEKIESLFRRFGRECFFCGVSADQYWMTRDHLWPICRGGMDTIGNLVPACSACNTKKGDRRPTEEEMEIHASRWGRSVVFREHNWEEIETAYVTRLQDRLRQDQILKAQALEARLERKRQASKPRDQTSWIPRHLKNHRKKKRLPPPTPEQIEAFKTEYMAGRLVL